VLMFSWTPPRALLLNARMVGPPNDDQPNNALYLWGRASTIASIVLAPCVGLQSVVGVKLRGWTTKLLGSNI